MGCDERRESNSVEVLPRSLILIDTEYQQYYHCDS